MTTYNIVANSTFLDAFGADAVGSNTGLIQALASITGTDAAAARATADILDPLVGMPGAPADITPGYNLIPVGIMLQRAGSPSAINTVLNGDWADRQSAIANQGNTWSTFGADPTTYNNTVDALKTALGGAGALTAATQQGYISNAQDRTIWMMLDPTTFKKVFDSTMLTGGGVTAWTGPLKLPDTIALSSIAGIWVDWGNSFNNPVHGGGIPANLPAPSAGPISLGNSAPFDNGEVTATPAAIAASYNFPLSTSLSAPAIGLIESGMQSPNLLASLNVYRQELGLAPLTPQQFQVLSGGDTAIGSGLGETALDVSVLSSVAPNSSIYLYGTNQGMFQAYQNAFFTPGHPDVLSSSWAPQVSMTANSPFQAAWQQLFVDGMLNGVSVHIAVGDQGSNGFWPNGSANGPAGTVPAYAMVVGGTSIATPFAGASDTTLATIYQQAMQGDPATIFELVQAGLTAMPSSLSAANPATLTAGSEHAYAGQLTHLIESVWNQYSFVQIGKKLGVGFGTNQSGSGGVDPTQPTPAYQSAYGLSPGSNPASPNGGGRGAPDVSALAGGDSGYAALGSDFVTGKSPYPIVGTGGTSAAAPLWATLTSQFNVIFHDQGLPSLGFYNDLLYIAAAVAPASFNDIQLGNNDSGFYYTAGSTGYVAVQPNGHVNELFDMQPTLVGFQAVVGYDLASGLGTPNGTLLARALTQVAAEQMYHKNVQAFLGSDGAGGWDTGHGESLLFQTSASSAATVHVSVGSEGHVFATEAADQFAWNARLAEESLQPGFDPNLVKMFDGQTQGALYQATAGNDMALAIRIDGVHAGTPQAGITTPFGFADYTTQPSASGYSPDVRVALPVAIAETAGGANDTTAIVRLRQGGENATTLTIYKVDDYQGSITIGGATLHPGDAGYAAAAQARAYQVTTGGTAINGPGFGQFTQTGLSHVNSNDIIAFKLTNNTTGETFWSFANANETVNGQHVAHVWNYGMNVWGFEDMHGGGDRDYNDLVLGLDFTSTAGHGYLVS